MRNRKYALFWVRNQVKNMSFGGDVECIVALKQAKFHHTNEQRNKTGKKKKAEPNLDLHRDVAQMIWMLQP